MYIYVYACVVTHYITLPHNPNRTPPPNQNQKHTLIHSFISGRLLPRAPLRVWWGVRDERHLLPLPRLLAAGFEGEPLGGAALAEGALNIYIIDFD